MVPFMLHFFHKHKLLFNFSYGATELAASDLFNSAVAQLSTVVLVHYVCIVVETNLDISDIKVWLKHRGIYIYGRCVSLLSFLLSPLPPPSSPLLSGPELHSNPGIDHLRVQHAATGLLLLVHQPMFMKGRWLPCSQPLQSNNTMCWWS